MAEGTCYVKLRSLEKKGCINVVGTVQGGTRIRLHLPSEIAGVIPPAQHSAGLGLEDMDFFDVPENRLLIFRRENERCFYCSRTLNATNYVIEHLVSRPNGNNTYRNVVAACMNCNNKKGKLSAEDFLRDLYRNNYLSAEGFDDRMSAVQLLRDGRLKPDIQERL